MTSALDLFLPCPLGVEDLLAQEAFDITGLKPHVQRAGVWLRGDEQDMMALNLHSRMAQRVLLRVWHGLYRDEQDIYEAATAVAWEDWFGARDTFRIDTTANRSPLKSLNFATLRIKDAIVDRFREREGERPSVDTHQPRVRLTAHLDAETLGLFIDTSGEPLFKRGWRQDKGDAPLKETLAAALIAATGWDPHGDAPLYDPCCGSGTIPIEAAQMACRVAPGLERRFGFERLRGFNSHIWRQMQTEAQDMVLRTPAPVRVFGSDVSHRMVDFAQRNAERAGVAQALELRGGDALQRTPPSPHPGILLLNPPYGERIDVAGVAGSAARGANRRFQSGSTLHTRAAAPHPAPDEGAAQSFYNALSAHWKTHFDGWTAWVLTPDMKLPGLMRLKESRRLPVFNGPIDCRLFRFDLTARRVRDDSPTAP